MTEQPQTSYSQHPSAYQTDYTRKGWRPSPVQAISAAAAIIALLCGIVVGQATASTPKECEVALNYSEEALGYSGDAMGVVSEALGGGYSAMSRATRELDPITEDLKRITPLYQDAREECLK